MEFIDKIKVKLLHYTWCIAYGHYNESIVTQGIDLAKLHIVKNPYKDKWFADPFILEDNENNIQFLVEEFDKSVGRGRIARITVDKETDIVTECNILLEEQTHLSFPAIYRRDGKIYVHPENYSSGKSFIYEYDRKNDKLINKTLLSEQPLTDAIIFNEKNRFKLLSTLGTDPNGSELSVFSSDNFLGPYVEETKVFYPNKTARMAGYVINTDNGLVRPAQNCDGAYGKNVIFFNGTEKIGELVPWGVYNGLHTFNSYKKSFVIDLKKYDYRFIYKIKNFI